MNEADKIRVRQDRHVIEIADDRRNTHVTVHDDCSLEAVERAVGIALLPLLEDIRDWLSGSAEDDVYALRAKDFGRLLDLVRDAERAERKLTDSTIAQYAEPLRSALALLDYLKTLTVLLRHFWHADWPHELWDVVFRTGPGQFKNGEVTAAHVRELQSLAARAGGWWSYLGEGRRSYLFVPTSLWLPRHEAWNVTSGRP